MGALPPVFIEFIGSYAGLKRTVDGVKTELAEVETTGGGNMAKLGAVSQAALLGIGLAAGAAAIATVHMAADFQTQMTRVQTGAGEAQANMKMVGNGVLAMAGQVGQSTEQLTSGLYTVESAGYHGADALNVLKASAMGAKVGAADLAPVTDAVTTALNAYSLKASDATGVMNALVATEAAGKTNMEALAGSMASILPVASAAHVGLNEVLGAMATMTAQGTSADVAATYLKQTISQLSNPSAKAANEMKGLGLNSVQVAQNLGKNGLASTLTELTDAIQNKMGPAGTVVIDTLRKASANTTDYQKALANLKPDQQTYIGALADMVGGTKSMMGALQLTGPHMKTFQDNTKSIVEHVKNGGNAIEGWKEVQGTLNQKLAEAKGAMQAIGIEIGQKLLPYASKMVEVFSTSVTWLTRHHQVVVAVGAAIGGILVVGIVAATVAMWNFTAALLANPVVWIVVGIMALIAGLVLLIANWKKVWGWISTNIPFVANLFKSIWRVALADFHAVWQATMNAVHAVVKWFDDNVLKWLEARSGEMTKWWKKNGAEVKEVWALLWKDVQLIAGAVWDWLGVAIGVVEDVLRTAWDAIVDSVKLAWSLISNAVTFGIHFVLNVIQLALDVLTGHWGKVWGDLVHLVGQAFTDLWNFLAGLGSSLWNLVSDVGSDIVHGIVNGIEGSAGAIGTSLTNIAKGALSSVKSMLGINSPSRVFADEVGQWIPHGIAQGIQQHAGVATSAVAALAGGTLGQFGTIGGAEPALSGSAGQGGSSGSGGAQTVINVTVQGSVTADRDLANTIQKVMGQYGARNSTTYTAYKR